MRIFILTICFLCFKSNLLAQALMSFQLPMLNPTTAFFDGNYDTSLLRKNKVTSCSQNNVSFYFDSNGRLLKSILIPYDSATQVIYYSYDKKGALIRTEEMNPNLPKPLIISFYKTYKDGLLIKDSSNSGYLCKHIEYYEDGSLKQELWFGFDHRYNTPHRLRRGFWFGVDSADRLNRIIDRVYWNEPDSIGQLLSNRTLFYNEKDQLIKEEENVVMKENNEKTIFCPNAGSATFVYDPNGRIIEIVRKEGPSQIIKYLPNGLIASIETRGKNCEGNLYHWQWYYTYTYHQ